MKLMKKNTLQEELSRQVPLLCLSDSVGITKSSPLSLVYTKKQTFDQFSAF